ETRLLLEVTEEAMDEIDKEAEEEQQQASPTAQGTFKKPSQNTTGNNQDSVGVTRVGRATIELRLGDSPRPPSVASLHPVPLGAAALYDTLCWKAPSHFDVHDANGKPISSVTIATKNKEDTFANFFDMESIRKTCSKYKLKFGFREVIPEGANRGEGTGSPVISMLDEAKKDKRMKRGGTDWSREGHRTGISQQMAKERLVDLKAEIKDVEIDQKAKRDE
ncbi:hypothetical protein BGX24_006178, partial [Mortierella sp. AD032]